jgi:hypothetical protein
MTFMFRVEKITVREGNTVLTGNMISGALDWRQRIEVQVEADMETVFTASLRGVASTEDTGLTLNDPASCANVLALPLSVSREKRIGLILDGTPPGKSLPVPAIAVGFDASPRMAANEMPTAFQSADAPSLIAPAFGVPVREYPFWINRLGMFYFEPWSLFLLTTVLSCVFVAGLYTKSPLLRPSTKWYRRLFT